MGLGLLNPLLYIHLNQLKTYIMSKLKFSDGEEFDVSGEMRAELRSDGWYVVGGNMLIPVKDEKEANKIIDIYKK